MLVSLITTLYVSRDWLITVILIPAGWVALGPGLAAPVGLGACTADGDDDGGPGHR